MKKKTSAVIDRCPGKADVTRQCLMMRGPGKTPARALLPERAEITTADQHD
jgi:hypothetical protein